MTAKMVKMQNFIFIISRRKIFYFSCLQISCLNFTFFEKVALLCGFLLKKYCFLHKDFIVNIATIIAWEFLTLVPCYGLTIVLFCSEYEKCISLSSLLNRIANFSNIWDIFFQISHVLK